MFKANLTFDMINPLSKNGTPNKNYPEDRKCMSGHILPEGTIFYKVTGDPDIFPKQRWGVYCEHCIKTAHMLADKKRRSSKNDGN